MDYNCTALCTTNQKKCCCLVAFPFNIVRGYGSNSIIWDIGDNSGNYNSQSENYQQATKTEDRKTAQMAPNLFVSLTKYRGTNC